MKLHAKHPGQVIVRTQTDTHRGDRLLYLDDYGGRCWAVNVAEKVVHAACCCTAVMFTAPREHAAAAVSEPTTNLYTQAARSVEFCVKPDRVVLAVARRLALRFGRRRARRTKPERDVNADG